jgi:hypothetical protein
MGDWADAILAGSNLPDDDFTFSDASSFGLPTFEFDEEENEGVLDGARLPEVKGLSELPGDLVIAQEDDFDENDIVFDEEDEDGLNLGDYVDETAIERTASLSDLDWLDPTTPQDPDRLPDSPTDKGVLRLEEAWGLNRRTDGLNLVPNKDRDVIEYEKSLEGGPESGLPEGDVKHSIKTAIQWAFREAAEGKSLGEIKRALVARLGNHARFTRSAVKKIKADEGLAGNVFLYAALYPEIHKGRTASKVKEHLRKKKARYVVVPPGEKKLSVWRAIGKTPVESVPWKKALAHYGPMLEATGHALSGKTARKTLKKAFLSGPETASLDPTPKPVDVRPSERVGVQEALTQFRTAEAIPRQAIDMTTRVEEAKRKKALVQIARWVKAGHMTREEAQRLAREPVSPEMLLRTATLMTQNALAEGSTYGGGGAQFDVGKPTTEVFDSSERVKLRDVDSLLKWARIQMSEGTAGKELDQLMRLRFSKAVIKSASAKLRKIRAKHEGLSGHVYVDALAYASKKGTEGCERGARTHRTGGIKAVLAMKRCRSCTLQNADGVCSLYNKPLVDGPPVKDPRGYQRSAIKAANSSDAEVTASLFANTYDEAEYSLTDPLQEIGFDESTPPEELGEILFGDGMEL